jgi:hypothetical protein
MADENGVGSIGRAGVEQGFEASGGAAKVGDGLECGDDRPSLLLYERPGIEALRAVRSEARLGYAEGSWI